MVLLRLVVLLCVAWMMRVGPGKATTAVGSGTKRLQPVRLPACGYFEVQLDIKKSRFEHLVRQIEELSGCITSSRGRITKLLNFVSAVDHSSDDGEPSGTAGMPMRAVLEGSGLFGVVVVVTRYFGGIKLGTGSQILFRCPQDVVEGARLVVSGVPAAKVSALYNTKDGQRLLTQSFSANGDAQAVLWVPRAASAALAAELRDLAPSQDDEEGNEEAEEEMHEEPEPEEEEEEEEEEAIEVVEEHAVALGFVSYLCCRCHGHGHGHGYCHCYCYCHGYCHCYCNCYCYCCCS
eukprot:s1233_g4.t1